MADKDKKKKESIFDLSKYIDKHIRVKFQGGREASGVLKGFDPLLNLVLDGTIEYMRDPDDQYKLTEDTRQLGLVVCRGTSVVLICPQDGMEAIPNPFIQHKNKTMPVPQRVDPTALSIQKAFVHTHKQLDIVSKLSRNTICVIF
ncbi:hypothetical protein PO909_027459 [Leuciscus waleckii]